jgi:hypothetical protein
MAALDGPPLLNLATRFAKLHGSPAVAFWVAPVWREGYLVSARRLNEEEVSIKVRPVGHTSLEWDGSMS